MASPSTSLYKRGLLRVRPRVSWWIPFCYLLLAWSSAARADTIDDYDARIAKIRQNSMMAQIPLDKIINDPKSTQKQKHAAIDQEDALWDGEYLAQILAGQRYHIEQSGRIGRTMLAGLSPVGRFGTGTSVSLTFDFIDPGTGQPNGGPAITCVEYAVNLDPETPSVFTPVGESSDAADGFAVPFTVTGYEPVIRATPFDASGDPIFIDGLDGQNVAVGYAGVIPPGVVPEPSTGWAMAPVMSTLIWLVRRRSPRRRPQCSTALSHYHNDFVTENRGD